MRCGNVMALQIREIVFGSSLISGVRTVVDHLSLIRLGAPKKNHDVFFRCVWFHCFVDYESTNFIKIVSLCFVCFCTMPFLLSDICICWNAHCPMTDWVSQWKPFWVPVDDSFKKASVEERVFQVTDTSDFSFFRKSREFNPETPKVSMPVYSSTWGPWNDEDTALLVLEKVLRHHCTHCSHDILVNVWNCPSPVMIVCLVTRIPSGSDHFTMWGKMSAREILVEHVDDIHKIEADFRGAFERIQSSSSQTPGVNEFFLNNLRGKVAVAVENVKCYMSYVINHMYHAGPNQFERFRGFWN